MQVSPRLSQVKMAARHRSGSSDFSPLGVQMCLPLLFSPLAVTFQSRPTSILRVCTGSLPVALTSLLPHSSSELTPMPLGFPVLLTAGATVSDCSMLAFVCFPRLIVQGYLYSSEQLRRKIINICVCVPGIIKIAIFDADFIDLSISVSGRC